MPFLLRETWLGAFGGINGEHFTGHAVPVEMGTRQNHGFQAGTALGRIARYASVPASGLARM
jgi:hypothetical protein